MKFNPYNIEPKLLVSDSLKDALPEEQLQEAGEMFITVGIALEPREISLTGSLVGIEFTNPMKVDMKVSLREAFAFISNVVSNKQHNKTSEGILLLLGEDVTSIPGPFAISSVKIVEIDPANKLCVLAVDLTLDTQ